MAGSTQSCWTSGCPTPMAGTSVRPCALPGWTCSCSAAPSESSGEDACDGRAHEVTGLGRVVEVAADEEAVAEHDEHRGGAVGVRSPRGGEQLPQHAVEPLAVGGDDLAHRVS